MFGSFVWVLAPPLLKVEIRKIHYKLIYFTNRNTNGTI